MNKHMLAQSTETYAYKVHKVPYNGHKETKRHESNAEQVKLNTWFLVSYNCPLHQSTKVLSCLQVGNI